jgi:hypothetical protein
MACVSKVGQAAFQPTRGIWPFWPFNRRGLQGRAQGTLAQGVEGAHRPSARGGLG